MATGVITRRQVWAEVRKAVEAGASYEEASARFGITAGTIKNKSYRQQWRSPCRLLGLGSTKEKAKAPPSEGETDFSSPSAREPNQANREITEICNDSALVPHRSALLAAADHSPAAFQAALKTLARTALAEGAAQLPIPRTIGEYRQMVSVLDPRPAPHSCPPCPCSGLARPLHRRHHRGEPIRMNKHSRPIPAQVDGLFVERRRVGIFEDQEARSLRASPILPSIVDDLANQMRPRWSAQRLGLQSEQGGLNRIRHSLGAFPFGVLSVNVAASARLRASNK